MGMGGSMGDMMGGSMGDMMGGSMGSMAGMMDMGSMAGMMGQGGVEMKEKVEKVGCKTGEVAAYMTENADYGSNAGECTEICIPSFVLQWMPEATEGTCASVGYATMVRSQNVQPAGSPMSMDVSIYGAATEDADEVVEATERKKGKGKNKKEGKKGGKKGKGKKGKGGKGKKSSEAECKLSKKCKLSCENGFATNKEGCPKCMCAGTVVEALKNKNKGS